MISISPERGQGPYVSSTGNIQIAGHNQSPAGSWAVTSIRPNLIFAPTFVLIRPDLTGLMIEPLVMLVELMQSVHLFEEQMPSLVRFKMLPSVSTSFASCREGLMYSMPFWMKTFSSVIVVSSNWPLLLKINHCRATATHVLLTQI